VGRFQATATVDRSDLGLGDAATLRFRVEGGGNLKWVDRGPEVTVNGAKVYPPQVKSDFHTSATGITGSRTWEYVVVPQTAGTLEIPSLAFSYFDPSAARIVRSTTPAIPLRVAGGAPVAGLPALPSSPRALARGGPLRLRTDLGPTGSGGRLLPPWSAGSRSRRCCCTARCGAASGSRACPCAARRADPRRAAPRRLRDLDRVGRERMSKERRPCSSRRRSTPCSATWTAATPSGRGRCAPARRGARRALRRSSATTSGCASWPSERATS
jgi:hypothetical protein